MEEETEKPPTEIAKIAIVGRYYFIVCPSLAFAPRPGAMRTFNSRSGANSKSTKL